MTTSCTLAEIRDLYSADAKRLHRPTPLMLPGTGGLYVIEYFPKPCGVVKVCHVYTKMKRRWIYLGINRDRDGSPAIPISAFHLARMKGAEI